MYVKSNTGSNADGRVQLKINGETVIDQNIRWTTNDSKRFINNLSFHTFVRRFAEKTNLTSIF